MSDKMYIQCPIGKNKTAKRRGRKCGWQNVVNENSELKHQEELMNFSDGVSLDSIKIEMFFMNIYWFQVSNLHESWKSLLFLFFLLLFYLFIHLFCLFEEYVPFALRPFIEIQLTIYSACT